MTRQVIPPAFSHNIQLNWQRVSYSAPTGISSSVTKVSILLMRLFDEQLFSYHLLFFTGSLLLAP